MKGSLRRYSITNIQLEVFIRPKKKINAVTGKSLPPDMENRMKVLVIRLKLISISLQVSQFADTFKYSKRSEMFRMLLRY